MKRNVKRDRLACFQWIRDIRAEMSQDMADMSLEERAAYLRARHEEAQKSRRRRSHVEAKKERDKILYPEQPRTKDALLQKK